MEERIKILTELIKEAKNIVFFGGAGVSTESGIKDFRSEDGLYSLKSKWGVPYEVMLSHSYFFNKTENFYSFYREFMISDAKPNFAHLFLSELEKDKNKSITIITQNIDGLHQLAGSKNVLELHGSIHRNFCTKCARQYSLNDILKMDNVPKCPVCGGLIKPDVVLYEEPLNEAIITKAIIALQKADLLIIAGTSLNVYPAAGLINYFFGDNIVLINKEHLPLSHKIKLEINEKCGEIFKKVSENLKL